jgi:hypothetical protein
MNLVHRLSSKADGISADQQILRVLRILNFQYRFQNSSLLCPVPSRLNPVQTPPPLQSLSLIFISTLSSNLSPCLERGLFPSGFPIKLSYVFISPAIQCRGQRMSGATHPLPQYAFMAWCLVKAQG